MDIREAIIAGKTSLGIEFGSTRIKAVLIDSTHSPIASGGHSWSNRYENGCFTYSLDDIWDGVRSCYSSLVQDVYERYGVKLEKIGSMGISAMMHGYMPFDRNGELLTPFRTWRNTTTAAASEELSGLLGCNIPQRWSIAHLRQAMLNGEPHVNDICYLTTLAGYVHWKLTGQFVLGVGDASGMFPIDSATGQYNAAMLDKFYRLAKESGASWDICKLLPRILTAGENAGALTDEGARLLDPTGCLKAGVPMCPPEGDAGTGMTATGSVAARTGNVSAGTSVFAMVVMEKELAHAHSEIDMVTTPAGLPVAMVHCNTCTSDIDAWAGLFGEAAAALGANADKAVLFNTLYSKALEGDADCGGLLSFGNLAGEPISKLSEGRPLLARMPDSRFTLANVMRSLLFSAVSTLRLGMDILLDEGVKIDRMLGHGGFFKTPVVGQRVMAAALDTPVTVMTTAGEGGAWGMALLAAFMTEKADGQSLEDYLDRRVFADGGGTTLAPEPADRDSFAAYMERYKVGLDIERSAVSSLK